MIRGVQDVTQVANLGQALTALNEAQDWCANRILVMDEDVLKVTGDEMAISADTRTFDLAANVSTGVLYQLKWLGVKLSTDTIFNPVEFVNSSSDAFILADQSTTGASGHPILTAIENFDQVRFAPFLQSGDAVRADYIYKPADLDLDSNVECDLPVPFHWAVVNKARALQFMMIDDDRAQNYDLRALDTLQGALNVLGQRQLQQRPRTAPFGVPRNRWYGPAQSS